MAEKLTKAKYSEWLASLTGASIIALGLGSIFSSVIGRYAYLLIVVGVMLHAWGMYRTHRRNK